MAKKNKTFNFEEIKYIKLAFEQASINLGSTKMNPSVGCVIVKNNSIISSGRTSFNGRPHAEANALKKKINFKNSDLYVTLEPCSHYGKTPPCIKNIIDKKLNKVYFSINDTDRRSKNLAYKKLQDAKIKVKKSINKDFAKKFYKSYFLQTSEQLPFIDAKLAISKDYLTINKKKKWITNNQSRKIGNFLRSKYDCLISTSKTINYDNPLLNCRIEGLKAKSPAVVIVDRMFKIKRNLKIFRNIDRKIFIFTQINDEAKKKYFKKIGVTIVKINKKKDLKKNLLEIFFFLKKHGFNRILIESGITYINEVLRYSLIRNFFLFKSYSNLKRNGKNNTKLNLVKKLKTTIKNKVKINLNGDSLYKIQL
jgi:diaminohydroxyphosphoribosylaminopyrimidine deaminase / 5-amino-6-(5-phosphoribosylamino)uracil reductase